MAADEPLAEAETTTAIAEPEDIAGSNDTDIVSADVDAPEDEVVAVDEQVVADDIEAIKEWVEAFGLRPVVVPDIGDSMDGHLIDKPYSPLTLGGAPLAEIATMGESIATLVIGRSIAAAADRLEARTGVPAKNLLRKKPRTIPVLLAS